MFYRQIRRWPSTIFKLLFIDGPHPTAIREVSAFFYGNGLSLRYASFFFVVCNERTGILETHAVFTHYCIWYTEKQKLHHAKYYNN